MDSRGIPRLIYPKFHVLMTGTAPPNIETAHAAHNTATMFFGESAASHPEQYYLDSHLRYFIVPNTFKQSNVFQPRSSSVVFFLARGSGSAGTWTDRYYSVGSPTNP